MFLREFETIIHNMSYDYTVVVPAYNEALSLRQAIDQLVFFCREQSESIEILIVENGSADETWSLAQELGAEHEEVRALQSKKGKGAAILEGWRQAKGAVVMFIDADLSPSLETLPRLYQSVKETGGCAAADRFLPTSSVQRSLKREVISRLWARIASVALPLPRMDYQCGAKACRRDHVTPLITWITSENWFFDIELLSWFQQQGLPIERVQTTWNEAVFEGRKSHLPILRTGAQFIRRLFGLRQRLRHH